VLARLPPALVSSNWRELDAALHALDNDDQVRLRKGMEQLQLVAGLICRRTSANAGRGGDRS